MKNNLSPAWILGVAGVSAALLSGCVSGKLRQDARATVTQLAEKSKAREDAYIGALSYVIRQQVEADRARLVEAFQRKRAEAKNRVVEAYERQQAASFESATSRLKGVMNPLTSKYYQDLEKEKVRAQQIGSRETEYLLGAQLAATMVEGMRQEAELHETIRIKLAKYRTEALQELDSIPLPAELANPVSEEKVRQILEATIANSNAYKKAVDDTEKALADFISKTDPQAVATQFLRGLGGEQLAQLVSGKVAGLMEKAETQANGLFDNLTRIAEKKIAEMSGAQVATK